MRIDTAGVKGQSMTSTKPGFVLAVAITVLASIAIAEEEPAAPDLPSAEGLPWRIVLEQQLKAEKGCDMRELYFFNELELGETTVIEGKIACIDGRDFDFSRPRAHQKFELRLCERTLC